MVINNSVVFIPIPKNASWSVEDTCIEYKLDLKYPYTLWENSIRFNTKPEQHIHSTIESLSNVFGSELEYVCLIRNSTDRFISAWKYFIIAMVAELKDNSDVIDTIKNIDNSFLINFIKENYSDFQNVYVSVDVRKKLLFKLLNKMEISTYLQIDENFKTHYSLHILPFISQYRWITTENIKVKEFSFEKLYEFEKYISDKFNIEFKLIHTNVNSLDYTAVTKTKELIDFVETYIDGMYKKSKSII